MRSLLLWVIPQRMLVVIYRRFGQHIGPVFTGQAVKMGTTGCPQMSVKITNTRCVTQTSAYGISKKNAVQNSRLQCRKSNWSYEDEGLYTMTPEDSRRQCTQHCPIDITLTSHYKETDWTLTNAIVMDLRSNTVK